MDLHDNTSTIKAELYVPEIEVLLDEAVEAHFGEGWNIDDSFGYNDHDEVWRVLRKDGDLIDGAETQTQEFLFEFDVSVSIKRVVERKLETV